MILDIIILLILIIPMAAGRRRGLAYMTVHAFIWIGALVASVFLTRPVAEAMENGFVGEMVSESLTGRFETSMTAPGITAEGLPDIISGGLKVTAESVSDVFVSMLTSVIVSILSFLIVVFLIRLIAGILLKPAAKRRDRSLLTGTDRLLGMIMGFVKGILLVFIFLAALVPIVGFISTGMSETIVDALKNSILAGGLYDSNFLLVITGGIFS